MIIKDKKNLRKGILPVLCYLYRGAGTLKKPSMAELKTKQTTADVGEFILSFTDSEQKRKDSFELIRLMREVTGSEPRMWGASMIGFGSYHYKSERSRQEGDWPLIGFPRGKQPFHSMFTITTETPHRITFLKTSGNSPWAKAAFTSKNFPISTRKY